MKFKNTTMKTSKLFCTVAIMSLASIANASGWLHRPPACADGYSNSMNELLQLVSIRKGALDPDKGESRVTFEDQAMLEGAKVSDLYARYPTRKFFCGDVAGEASVVGRENVVLLSAHLLYDENCALKEAAKSNKCFLNDIDGKNYAIDISHMVSGVDAVKAKGGGCHLSSLDGGGAFNPDLQDIDWAAVRLKGNVKNVKPYCLEVARPSSAGAAYIMVAAAAKNFGERKAPPHSIQSCQWRDRGDALNGRFFMKTDCDTGPWMSGAPMLNGSCIEGIHVGSTHNPDGLPYDKDHNFSTSAPVTQEMYDAVESLANSSDLNI